MRKKENINDYDEYRIDIDDEFDNDDQEDKDYLSRYYYNDNNTNNNDSNDYYDSNTSLNNYNKDDYDKYYGNVNNNLNDKFGNSYYKNDYYGRNTNFSNTSQSNNYYGKWGIKKNDENINNSENKKIKNTSDTKSKIILYILIVIVGIVFVVLITFVVLNLLKSYEIAFELNGASIVKDAPTKCHSNIFGHCYVTLPYSNRENGEIIGYSIVSDSKEAQYKEGDKIELIDDTILYVISKSENVVNINTNNIDEVETSSVSCSIYNKEKSCELILPQFNKKGYLNIGYSKEENDINTKVRPGDKIELTESINYYPVYDNYYLKRKISVSDISKSIKINNGYIDITSSCPSNIADKAVEYIKIIESKYPFIIKGNKITLMSSSEFHKYSYTNSSVKGITFYGVNDKIPSVFISCEENISDIYTVIFHELMHVFDIQGNRILGKYFSSNKDITNAFSQSYYNRVLRNYAYSSKEEFFAELLANYYFNYVETAHQSNWIKDYRNTLNDDLKKIAEKYICIGNNNYDTSKCN